MAKSDAALVEAWREIGPVAWAESPHGWVCENGAPIVLEPWQRAALAAWWERRADVSTFAISHIKKVGKTLLNAVLLAYRFLSLPGQHFAVGNDSDQSAGRQFAEIAAMIKRHPYLKSNCKIERERIIFRPTDSEILALAADFAGNAGANHITASHTEAWAISYENGIRAYEELTPPPGLRFGAPALRIVDSYAGFENGESDTWHKLVDAGLSGELINPDWPIFLNGGVLLFHAEGEDARRCFRGTPDQAAKYYADQRAQLRPMAFQRLHENKRTSGAEAFVTAEQWAAIETEDAPLPPTKVTPIYAGLDLAVKHDRAALVATAPSGDRRAKVALHKIWKAPKQKGGKIQLEEVKEFILEIQKNYWLSGVFYDPSQAALMAEQLEAEGVRMIEVPQSLPVLGPRGLALFEAVRDGRLTTYPDPELRAAALAAQAKEVSQGLHITKGTNQGRKIDPIAALSFCLPAALDGAPVEAGTIERVNPSAPSRWNIDSGLDPIHSELHRESRREIRSRFVRDRFR